MRRVLKNGWIITQTLSWLVENRSTEYYTAISSVNKDIIEVVDRFHLVKNMGECICGTISENYQDYRALVNPATLAAEIAGNSESIKKGESEQEIKKEDSRMIMFTEVKKEDNSIPLKSQK